MYSRREVFTAACAGAVVAATPGVAYAMDGPAALVDRLRRRWGRRRLALAAQLGGHETGAPTAAHPLGTLAAGLGALELRRPLARLTEDEQRHPAVQGLLGEMVRAAGEAALVAHEALGAALMDEDGATEREVAAGLWSFVPPREDVEEPLQLAPICRRLRAADRAGALGHQLHTAHRSLSRAMEQVAAQRATGHASFGEDDTTKEERAENAIGLGLLVLGVAVMGGILLLFGGLIAFLSFEMLITLDALTVGAVVVAALAAVGGIVLAIGLAVRWRQQHKEARP